MVDGKHTRFLSQITEKRAQRKVDGTWVTPKAEVVREAAETQSTISHIGKRQRTMAQWVVLRPILELCARETGYEGGGEIRDAWW